MQRKQKAFHLVGNFDLDPRARTHTHTHSQKHASMKMKNKSVNAKKRKIVERREMFQEKREEGEWSSEIRKQIATNKRANELLHTTKY